MLARLLHPDRQRALQSLKACPRTANVHHASAPDHALPEYPALQRLPAAEGNCLMAPQVRQQLRPASYQRAFDSNSSHTWGSGNPQHMQQLRRIRLGMSRGQRPSPREPRECSDAIFSEWCHRNSLANSAPHPEIWRDSTNRADSLGFGSQILALHV